MDDFEVINAIFYAAAVLALLLLIKIFLEFEVASLFGLSAIVGAILAKEKS